MYKDVAIEESIRGIKFWQNPGNKFHVLMLHYTADEDKDPERNGAEWFRMEKEGTPKAKWNKEYEIDFTTKSGKLVFGPDFCDFDPAVHFIQSRDLGDTELVMALDFGQRNPTCALIGAVDRDGRVYIIDEYYKPAIPSVSSRDMFDQFSYLMPDYKKSLSLDEKRELADRTFQIKVIDPTTSSKNRTKIIEGEEIPYSVLEDFYDNGWDFEKGNHDWDAGITRVREYFSIDANGLSNLYIFQDKCPHLVAEITKYKYHENTESTDRKQNEPERPVKKNDHSVDSLRYLIATRPNNPVSISRKKTIIEEDFENALKPKLYNDFDIS